MSQNQYECNKREKSENDNEEQAVCSDEEWWVNHVTVINTNQESNWGPLTSYDNQHYKDYIVNYI